MKKRICLLVLCMLFTTVCLLSCNALPGGPAGDNGEKQIPIYKGMSIVSAKETLWSMPSGANAVAPLAVSFPLSESDAGEEGTMPSGNTEEPSDDPDEPTVSGEPIEDQIESSFNVTGAAKDLYCATPNEDIYIHIHIENPDSFEIMSFTLNGKKYSDYMFEEGSDMETLILKYNVGDVSGIAEYTIDAIKYVDGTEIKDVRMEGDQTVRAGVWREDQVYATVSAEVQMPNSLSFRAEISDADALIAFSEGVIKAVLYDGERIVASKDLNVGANDVTFDGLTMNTAYQVAIAAYYDDLSGEPFGMHMLYEDTLATASVVYFEDVSVGQEGVEFKLSMHESILADCLRSLKLYRGNTLVKELSLSDTAISSLLSNNDYQLVAEYEFLGGTERATLSFTTLEKSAPTVEFSESAVTQDSLQGEYAVSDPDAILSSYKVELYQGELLIAENPDKQISFAELDYYTEYTVCVTLTYDQNDGKGAQTKVFCKKLTTLPYINVLDCRVVNTSSVSEGETIYLQVTLDNPLGATVTAVTVNGQSYQAVSSSTATRAVVEIVCSNQFSGGETTLTIDGIDYTLGGVSYPFAVEDEISDSVFINGKLEPLSIEITNTSFEQVSIAYPEDTLYCVLHFSNPTEYVIDAVSFGGRQISGDQLHRVDDETYYFVTPPYTAQHNKENELEYGYYYASLTGVTYHNDYVTKTDSVSGVRSNYCFRLSSSEVKYISCADDLLNMQDGCRYELTCDIDLAGIEWQGGQLIGLFDGKGYSIKNMTMIKSFTDIGSTLGLFSKAEGAICNLNMESVLYIVNLNTTDGSNPSCKFGALAARTETFLLVRNCTVDAASSVRIVNNAVANTSRGDVCIGGLIGRGRVTIENCRNDGKISFVNSDGNIIAANKIGGMIGYALDGSIIRNCQNNGEISAVGNVGGIVGQSAAATVENCHNSATVSVVLTDGMHATFIICGGGIVGQAGETAVIVNCLNSGEILSDGAIGGIVGHYLSDGPATQTPLCSVSNCYSIVHWHQFDTSCTTEQLDSRDFYTETLGWSEEAWDLSELDAENGKYPTPKP